LSSIGSSKTEQHWLEALEEGKGLKKEKPQKLQHTSREAASDIIADAPVRKDREDFACREDFLFSLFLHYPFAPKMYPAQSY
jgi:hypothetical protein